MFVSIHPTQLGKPVRVIIGVVSPHYLAINSVGEIIITEENIGVAVYDKEGKRIRSASHGMDYRLLMMRIIYTLVVIVSSS